MEKKVFIGLIILVTVVFTFIGCPNPTAPAVTYTVTYDANGATSGTPPEPQTKTKGVDLILATNSGNLQKTGYTFAGWNTQADGNGTDYAEGATYTTDADVTLYAKWTALPTYTVSYDGNGATSGIPPATQTKIKGVDLILATNSGNLEKTGYTFAGWNTQADGNGTDYAEGAIYTIDADMTLYAKWSANSGAQQTFTAAGVSFTMVMVPSYNGFPTETDDSGTASVSNDYWIGETEVTYELWYAVHTWAISNGYTFANAGREGNDGTGGAEPTSARYEPVTTINWRDAMVWCNALTEWYNAQKGTSLECVYYSDEAYTTPIRTVDDDANIHDNPGEEDNPYVKNDADGFRLLTSDEWELAARWRDDSTNTVSGYSNPWFTKGNSASGATTYYNDNTNGGGEPGKSANDLVAVYGYYWDGSSWQSTGVSGTAAVKGKESNSLGLYDMSGNVYEWCFDLRLSDRRVRRGGSWVFYAETLLIGYENTAFEPYIEVDDSGFRFARNP